MTGRDTFRTGMQYEVVEDSGAWGLPLEEVRLAERFKAAGYSTHMVHGEDMVKKGSRYSLG